MSKLENKELKVKSFRVNEETFSKFKDIASNEFGNQAQCLEALINIYETEESKSVLVGRGLEIETFQDYINKISRLFITSLQLSTDAESRAKESFVKKIEAKDESLAIIKEKMDSLKKDLISEKENVKLLNIKIKDLTSKNSDLESSKNTLSQLANRNYELSIKFENDLIEYKDKLKNFTDLEKKHDKLKENIIILNSNIEELNNKNKNISNNMEEMKIASKKLSNKIKEKDDEVISYKTLLEALKRESNAELVASTNKIKEGYKVSLKEREEFLKREFELDKRELALKIKELELQLNSK